MGVCPVYCVLAKSAQRLPHHCHKVLPSVKPRGTNTPKVNTSRLSRKKKVPTHPRVSFTVRNKSAITKATRENRKLPSGPPQALRMWTFAGKVGSSGG